MTKTEIILPDVTVRRISLPFSSDVKKTVVFFENTIQPALSPEKMGKDNFRVISRICAYSLLHERLVACFPCMNWARLSYGKEGKPYLCAPFHGIFINISHSHDFVMCGISACEIGVDIQKKRRIETDVITAIAPEICPEKAAQMTDSEKTALFCKKESQIKALGGSVLDLLSPHREIAALPSFAVEVPDSDYKAYYSLHKFEESLSFS